MFDKFRPLNDRVLLQRLKTEEKTESGLIIPEAAQEEAQTGKILAVGTGKRDADGSVTPLAVKAGDVVYCGKYAGTKAGKDHLILREDEILGVVDEQS